MSYLDRPRLHFSGGFFANPATLNNFPGNYGSSITTGAPRSWNNMGGNLFQLENCVIKMAIDANGKSTPGDPLVGGTVLTAAKTAAAKLVDIDPAFQTASAIWGARIQITLKGGGGNLTATMQTATLRDLYMQRTDEGFAKGFGGVYQAALKDLTVKTISSSPILDALSKEPALIIKFVTYDYDATPASANFNKGKVVGSIGPPGVADGEKMDIDFGVNFLHARRMRDAGSNAFGSAPFKLNAGKKRLTIDLGNCIPEKRGTGNEREALGDMEAIIVMPAPIAPILLGKLDYSKSHYEQTAGIEELDLIPANVKQLEKNPLGIRVGPTKKLVMVERPKGLYVDSTEIVFRVEANSSTVALLCATEFGLPKNGLKVEMELLSPAPPPVGLSFPASVTTNAMGQAAVTFKTTDPGHPRNVDGQLFRVGFHVGAPSSSTLEGSFLIRAYEDFKIPASPVYADVKPIMDQYSRLYPLMNAILDMSSHATMKSRKDRMIITMELPMEDPSFMPVTRDLSAAKTATILKWLKADCP